MTRTKRRTVRRRSDADDASRAGAHSKRRARRGRAVQVGDSRLTPARGKVAGADARLSGGLASRREGSRTESVERGWWEDDCERRRSGRGASGAVRDDAPGDLLTYARATTLARGSRGSLGEKAGAPRGRAPLSPFSSCGCGEEETGANADGGGREGRRGDSSASRLARGSAGSVRRGVQTPRAKVSSSRRWWKTHPVYERDRVNPVLRHEGTAEAAAAEASEHRARPRNRSSRAEAPREVSRGDGEICT